MSVPNKIMFRYPLRVSEFCYAIVRKITTMSKNVVCGCVGVPFTTRSALLSWPRLSQMVTRGGLQLTSNRTRATT